LQDIRGVLLTPASVTTPFPAAPSTLAIPTPRSAEATPTTPSPHPLSIKIPPTKLASVASIGARRLSASQRMATPLGVRARLNSLTHKSPSKLRGGLGHPTHGKTSSSSTATLHGTKRSTGPLSAPPQMPSPFSDEDESESSDEELEDRKEEEMERQAEVQEHLDKKLAQLQKMMTSERLGLVRSPVSPKKGKEREYTRRDEIFRGRLPLPASAIAVSLHPTGDGGDGAAPGSPSKVRFNGHTGPDVLVAEFTGAARNRDHSASVSSASSHQGSTPSIPSPSVPSPSPPPVHRHAPSPHDHSRAPNQHQTQAIHLHPNSQPPSLAGSPLQRHLSPTKSSSPPAVSARNARGHAHTRQGFGALGAAGVSEGESNHGSSASSFSDLSGEHLSVLSVQGTIANVGYSW